MPGKVNPVIPEMVNQVAYQVMGNDLTVMMACEGGQLQLNAFEPIMVANLFQSIDIIKRAMRILADRCVAGITPNTESCQKNLDATITLVTLLNPQLGYEVASELAMEALTPNRSIRELVLERGLMSSEAYDALVKASASLEAQGRPVSVRHRAAHGANWASSASNVSASRLSNASRLNTVTAPAISLQP